MKLGLSHGAVPTTSNVSVRADGTSIETGLQHLRKDSRLRKCALGTFLLLASGYAAVFFVSDHSCSVSSVSSYDSHQAAGSAYCKLAAWSGSVFTSTSDSLNVVLPARPSSSTEGNVSQSFQRRNGTRIDRIVFGIGANVATWRQRSEYVKLWWKPGVMRGFLWVDENLNTWMEGDPSFKVSEDTSRFGYTHPMQARSALRIARIATESYRLELPNVDWFVMGDDDTLFFPDNLVHVLSKYDHRELFYIGKNSEDTRQSERHLYGLAFGGGGFAISYPLAKALSETQDECMERYTGLYGSDERVKACISELGVPLTKEPGFHQLDVHGDISGLLAAHPVSPIVSLHHLDEIEPIFYGTTHLDAAKRLMKAVNVNSAGMFQQSICYDEAKQWSFSVSWGYVVEVYEGFLTPRELEMPARTFVSWAWRNDFNAFTMDTRLLAPVCARPTRFFMVDARTKGKGRTRVGTSSYDRLLEFEKENCIAKPPPLDTVKTVSVEDEGIVDDWYQSPRRQCCTVNSMDSRSIKIEVRACGQSQSLVVGAKVAPTRQTRRILR